MKTEIKFSHLDSILLSKNTLKEIWKTDPKKWTHISVDSIVFLYYKLFKPVFNWHLTNSIQFNQFNKHKTKDSYVPGTIKDVGSQKNITMTEFLPPGIQ